MHVPLDRRVVAGAGSGRCPSLRSRGVRACVLPSRADLYEAFVLWSFYKCMVESFGSEEALVARLEALQSSPMLAPCCCVRQRLSFQWLQRMTLGVAQYVFVRVTLSVLIFVLALAGAFDGWRGGEGRGTY